MYSTVAVTHYLSFFWCIGSVAVVDLRVIGIAARNRKVGELADQLFPWAWIAFVLAMISGFFMFATDASAWAPSPVFHVKLSLIAASAIFTYFVQRGVHKWALNPEMPQAAKIVALISLLLWVVTILSASEIPALEGLG
jgi:uncharacterized membrane protein YtjA (UPF0391 family)